MSDPFCRIFQQDNEDVQSDMDLDLLAESESDSETENEGNDARGSGGNVGGNPNDGSDNRNVETAGGGNAANNETFFSDDESGESSHGDEDESEAGETDEQDGDELTFEGGLSGGQFSLLVLWLMKFFFRFFTKPSFSKASPTLDVSVSIFYILHFVLLVLFSMKN